jgi:lysozyme
MSLNQASVDLIKEFEGFVDHWYPDPATNAEPWTAMYGHTNAAGEPKYTAATKNRRFTKAEGEAVLRSDLAAVERTVQALVKVPLTANQYGALVSFTFNLGAGNFGKSTLLKKVNAKDWNGAAREFAKWNKAAGKVMAGLTRRRAAEAALFSSRSGVADLSPVIPPPVAPLPVQETITVNVPTGNNTVTAPTKPQSPASLWAVLIALAISVGTGIAKQLGLF